MLLTNADIRGNPVFAEGIYKRLKMEKKGKNTWFGRVKVAAGLLLLLGLVFKLAVFAHFGV